MSKIIGNTVGTPLPKSNWAQTDPTKGDYIKNKPEVIEPTVGELLAIKSINEDGYITEFETVEIKALTIEEIDAICGVDDVTALVNGEFLFEATDSEGNTLTDGADNAYVF